MKAILEIVKIDCEDIITTSGLENVGTGGNNTGSASGTPVFPASLLD